jgi:hypothetical protein
MRTRLRAPYDNFIGGEWVLLTGPNFSTHRRTVSLLIFQPSLSQQIVDVSITQREA